MVDQKSGFMETYNYLQELKIKIIKIIEYAITCFLTILKQIDSYNLRDWYNKGETRNCLLKYLEEY